MAISDYINLTIAAFSALEQKSAQEYATDVERARVAENNRQIQLSAQAGATSLETNLIRATYKAESMREEIEKQANKAASTARVYAAANFIGAGSFDTVYSQIEQQQNTQEADISQSVTEEFVNAQYDLESLNRTGQARQQTSTSQYQGGLTTLLNFGKGALSLMTDSDKRRIGKTVDGWFN